MNERMNRPTVDQGGSVPLVTVATFDGPSLPSSPSRVRPPKPW